ncbi:MAG: ribosome small subunit-dependent GTPase A [Clostridia bacterium]|nr:ribosome small subunit-dependent GTPase A [Clostridia bacterium]
MRHLDGTIIKGIGGFYYVEVAEEIYECKARGNFRKNKISPLPGDRVSITVNDNGENTVDRIYERKSVLKRPPVANLDRLYIVVSVCDPKPNTLVIDKISAIACKNNIEPVIVITKTDLESFEEIREIYSKTKFELFVVTEDDESVEKLKQSLKGKVSAFCGNSGVGKTTLLNRIFPQMNMKTAQISTKLGRGKHTTRHVELLKIEGGYVADTPGFSSVDIEKSEVIRKDELPLCFPEFNDYLGECRFSTCSHTVDKGCAVISAVEGGAISPSRHENYKAMYDEVKNLKEWEING